MNTPEYIQEPDLSLSIIIPCYNEASRANPLINCIIDLCNWSVGFLEVILVDDGSSDNTLKILRKNPKLNKLEKIGTLKLIVLANNQGKGNALKVGVAEAKGKKVLTMDADIATNPIEVIRWKQQLGGNFDENTIYVASREHSDSKIKSGITRQITGRIFNLIVRTLTPLRLKDTQCGFKLYPAQVAKQLFANLENTGWAHDIELLYRAKLSGLSIKEMPVRWKSVEGSKISVAKDSFKMLIETVKIRRLLRKGVN